MLFLSPNSIMQFKLIPRVHEFQHFIIVSASLWLLYCRHFTTLPPPSLLSFFPANFIPHEFAYQCFLFPPRQINQNNQNRPTTPLSPIGQWDAARQHTRIWVNTQIFYTRVNPFPFPLDLFISNTTTQNYQYNTFTVHLFQSPLKDR